MRILIACEESQRVCESFRKKGHEAYSCDILPTSGSNPEWHIKDDVLNHLDKNWDMIIAFPPCTDLAVSGSRWFKEKQANGSQQKSIDFFMMFANHSCPKIVIENPIGIMSSHFRKPDQIIHPWMFGDSVSKKTCLWLKGVPKLIQTHTTDNSIKVAYSDKKMDSWMYNIRKNWYKMDKREISKTFQGIADAMADQWG